MKRFIVASVVLAVVFMAGFQAKADDPVVVYYSFNNTNLLNGTTAGTNAFLAADTGSSLSTFTYKLGNSLPTGGLQIYAGIAVGNQPGFVAGNSVGGNAWMGTTNYFQFTLNASGFEDIVVSWAANRSATGPTNVLFQYSTDGSTFTTYATVAITASSNLGYTQDLTSVTALDWNANDAFRIESTGAAAGGTLRIDNLTVGVPEPSTVFLVGCGLVGLLAMRRRRS
jgi:hypothetical protein